MAVTEAGHQASRAIDDLYRQHGPAVYRYAYAVLGNHADAEDVTQTTFLNAYRALEQGVHPRKPSNWLLTIASNAIKQRFRQEQARPRTVELDERLAGAEAEESDDPSVGELLTALSKIPPQQRQAIVLREFEGRSYAEIAGILGITTSALETLLFRARRSLAEELEHQLTCTEAQLAVSKSVDGRLGRKERRRLRDHLGECPDCAHFARLQQRHRSALRGLLLIPIPLSLSLFKGLEGAGSASAATIPLSGGGSAGAAATGSGLGATGAAGSGAVAGGVTIKAAALVAAATLAGGVAVVGAVELGRVADQTPAAASTRNPPTEDAIGAVAGAFARNGVGAPARFERAGAARTSARAREPVTPLAREEGEVATDAPQGGDGNGTATQSQGGSTASDVPAGSTPPEAQPPGAESQAAPSQAPTSATEQPQHLRRGRSQRTKPKKQAQPQAKRKDHQSTPKQQQPKQEQQKPSYEPRAEQPSTPEQDAPTSGSPGASSSPAHAGPANDHAQGSKP